MSDFPKEKISVLLVDDHTILRQGMKQLLEGQAGLPKITVVGEASNGEEALVQAITHKPDVILMDINMPKVSGYESTRSILTTWPEAKIIILTNQDDPNVVKKFMDLDIKGFILKDVPVDQLVAAISKAVAGETVELKPHLAEKMETAVEQAKGLDELTDREKEVLQALAKGLSNQELAEQFCVSTKTINNHLYNIYSKLGVNTRSEAIVKWMDVN